MTALQFKLRILGFVEDAVDTVHNVAWRNVRLHILQLNKILLDASLGVHCVVDLIVDIHRAIILAQIYKKSRKKAISLTFFLSPLYLYLLWEETKNTSQRNSKMNNQEQNQKDTTKETEKKCLSDKCGDIGIYGLKNKITGKWYVGQSITSIKNRWNEYRRINCYNQPKLINALRKYGYDAFDKVLLEECVADQSILNEREDYWIKYYDSVENGYNCRYGGANGKFSKEAKLNVKRGCLNKIQSAKWLEAMKENGKRQRGKIVSNQTKSKMSESQKKNKDNISRLVKLSSTANLGKMWITNGTENKKIINTDPVPFGYKKGRVL